MKIMGWNIRDGGACGRLDGIMESIGRHGPDVLVLTEYTSNRRKALEDGLRSIGYTNLFITEPPGLSYGVVIASRAKCKEILYDYDAPKMDHRWKEVYLPDADLRLLAISVPELGEMGREHSRKEFLQKLSEYCDFRLRLGDRVVIMGDFSADAVDNYLDREDEDPFQRVIEMGWRDPWQESGRLQKECSFFPYEGEGIRSDRTLLSPNVCSFDRDYRYLHQERIRGQSDHSMQLLDISFELTRTVKAGEHISAGGQTRTYDYPLMFGYGKSAALYWAFAEKASDMLKRYGDICIRPTVWFNPSFALGGKGSNAVGYFDGVVMGDRKVLVVKGEWNGVGPIYENIHIDDKTLERHDVFRWYLINWKLGYSWDFFARDHGQEYQDHFNKSMPTPDRIMARKLEKMLNRIHSHLDRVGDGDIKDILLYVTWVRPDEGVPDTTVLPSSFDLIRYDYPDEDESPYIEMPID